MSIRGKKEAFFRIIGSFLILLGFCLSIYFNFLALNNLFLYLASLLIIIPPFLTSIFLKLEQDAVVKNSTKILCVQAIVVITLNLIILATNSTLLSFRFIFIESSSLLLLSCWHFSLSIYIRNKVVFVISGIGSFALNIILWLNLEYLLIISVILILTLFFGLLLIILAELIMKKKGLLNYIN